MAEEAVQIQVRGAPVDWVSGIFNWPEGGPPAPQESGQPGPLVVLFAHGAGAGVHSEFMSEVAAGIAAGGFPVLRFQYAYSERMERDGGRRPPDRQPMLEAVHRGAAAFLRERFPNARMVFAGKSMGGRMASYLAAEGDEVHALCFFGYPLHPPGKPEKQRTDQFPAIAQPALFLQGTRDALCDLELLQPALQTFGGKAQLEVFEGADHGFRVLKASGTTNEATLEDLIARTVAWLRAMDA